MLRSLLGTLYGCLLCVFALATTAQSQSPIADPQWRMTTEAPPIQWSSVEFNDSTWTLAPGGFGTDSTPGSRVGTDWKTNDIWLRRNIELTQLPAEPALYVHHDEQAEIFINGTLAAKLDGYSTRYEVVRLSADAAKLLHTGKNLIAVHCHQTAGGQFIDVHVIDVDHVPKLPKTARMLTPFRSELLTEWGAKVTTENAWQEYPRPGMARKQWKNLNGQWDVSVTPKSQHTFPSEWKEKILVPFCLESKLGGVQKLLQEDEALWYRTNVKHRAGPNEVTFIHFEAVDYASEIYINGALAGSHVGGNVPFSIDATKHLVVGQNEIVVRVEDETGGAQLRGKQSQNPGGIFYTRVSGIWQTVWMETVPQAHIGDVKIQTNAKDNSITVRTSLGNSNSSSTKIPALKSKVSVYDGKTLVKSLTMPLDEPVVVQIDNARLWTPATPHLYDLVIDLLDARGTVIDSVTSYTGIRSVGKTRDANGHLRFTLNDQPIFHWGPLDQGWWPDGLLTPPSEAAMLYDIEYLKSAGFNMIRKHIKVEPRRYYYHCDRLGMLVWQDQVSGGINPPWTFLAPNPVDAKWNEADHKQFMTEFEAMVSELENHPTIVVWTPFNEAWGQHNTVEVGKWISKRDPSRLVNIASGGNFWPVGDIVDQHQYPHPSFPFDATRYNDFIKVVGEFGGHGLVVEGHVWDKNKDNWGYGGLPKNEAEYKERYVESIRNLVRLQSEGIAGGVYTQTTDVEGEVNGLMTYDRKHIKISAEELKAIHAPLFK